MKLSLEASNSLEAILILAKKPLLCIWAALWVWHRYFLGLCGGDTIVEGDKRHITTGREAQDCWAYSAHYMEGI